jgi:hypothetical protein
MPLWKALARLKDFVQLHRGIKKGLLAIHGSPAMSKVSAVRRLTTRMPLSMRPTPSA